MKLATLKNNSRDGQLIVVSRDRTRYVPVPDIAPNLQSALDGWSKAEPALEKISESLNGGKIEGTPIDLMKLMSPLPRAYEWVDGSAFINHIVLVRKSRGADLPETLRTEPLVYQGGSGVFLGPLDDIKIKDEGWGLDFESEVCVVLDDTPQGIRKGKASAHVKLLMLANDISLRQLIPGELAKGFGFFNSKPATAFSPFAVTPDELADKWRDGRVHWDLVTHYNGKKFGNPNAGPEMHFSFFDIIEHICKTRAFTAGTIVGSGTVSNEDRARGSSCLLEKRMLEKIDTGSFQTPFMKAGDTVAIEMFDDFGASVFGRIEQKVTGFAP